MEFKYLALKIVGMASLLMANSGFSQVVTSQSAPVTNPSFEASTPYLPGPLDPAGMLLPPKPASSKTKSYVLAATPATTQWGVFDSSQSPVLKINSGDTVIIETQMASNNQIVPGVTIDQMVELNDAVPGRGPHTLTGPIYINGAEPGDVLKIHFNKIVPRAYASNDNLPGGNKGLFPKEFPRGQLKYFYLDLDKMQTEFAPGINVPLAPFPGIIAVARAKPGKYDSIPPGPFGGNMDLREMTEGTTIYLPVFMTGALLWTGDSHAGQGNGEINLTALETAFKEFSITVDVIKQKPLEWPRIETPTSWITVGYDSDLNKALDILKGETVKFIIEQQKVSQAQAEKIMYENWNCPIAEVVNGIKGVYCMIPKQARTEKPVLLREDNDKFFVTYAKNADVEKAMSDAAMAMINKIVDKKQMTRLDVYSLLSLTMDCRIGPYQSGDKEVHCTVAKNIWV